MKVLPFKIPKPDNATLIIQEDKTAQLYDKLHQHQEIQISWIKKGEGNFIIGDHVGGFSEGDIFMIGENLPHVFRNDPSEGSVHMISIFFMKSTYGDQFFDLEEFKHLSQLFQATSLGIKLTDQPQDLYNLIDSLSQRSKLKRFISFIDLLDSFSKSKLNILSSAIDTKSYDEEGGKRMRDIFEYTLNNFQSDINLRQIAALANMTPHAFCRYFKQRTNKTYFNFLLEIRIGNACKLLLKNSDLSIAEISFKSGFNNQTNFNRQFKSIKGITPSQFRLS